MLGILDSLIRDCNPILHLPVDEHQYPLVALCGYRNAFPTSEMVRHKFAHREPAGVSTPAGSRCANLCLTISDVGNAFR